MQETRVWSLGQEDPLEEGMATHSSILAWKIPWTQRRLVGYSLWGCKVSDRTERLHRINKYQHQPKLPFCCIHYYRYTHTRMWIFELFIFLGNTFIFFLQFRVKILPILLIEANICHKSFLFILVVQQSSVVKSVSSGGLCLKQFPQTLWTSGFLSIKSWLILFTLHSYWEH